MVLEIVPFFVENEMPMIHKYKPLFLEREEMFYNGDDEFMYELTGEAIFHYGHFELLAHGALLRQLITIIRQFDSGRSKHIPRLGIRYDLNISCVTDKDASRVYDLAQYHKHTDNPCNFLLVGNIIQQVILDILVGNDKFANRHRQHILRNNDVRHLCIERISSLSMAYPRMDVYPDPFNYGHPTLYQEQNIIRINLEGVVEFNYGLFAEPEDRVRLTRTRLF